MLSIQRMTEENAADAGLVYSKSWQASHKGIVSDEYLATHTPKYKEDFLKRELGDSCNEIHLLYDDNIALGIIILNIETGEIKSLYISPEFWGKGYGKELIDYAVQRLKHFESVFLIVMNKNFRARNFYKKYGFVFSGEEKTLSVEKELSELKYIYSLTTG